MNEFLENMTKFKYERYMYKMALTKPTDVIIGNRYRIVEGLYDGAVGVVVDKDISSFNMVWYTLKKDDGTTVKTRWSDLEPT